MMLLFVSVCTIFAKRMEFHEQQDNKTNFFGKCSASVCMITNRQTTGFNQTEKQPLFKCLTHYSSIRNTRNSLYMRTGDFFSQGSTFQDFF
ncbi:hypothetical protein KP509_01G079600 [Ceratopteris richardii]|uniref:Uncharacterized protein n=1 Tax=Ceratopteris richardii TaxID=49495 RepID=A0A8T2VMT2_CERRI|nr:hypothetical protein KP509_01G079600 [Ceratopteris richardii]